MDTGKEPLVDPAEAQARALRRNCAKMGQTISELKHERRIVAAAGDAVPAAALAKILVRQSRKPRAPPVKAGPPPRTEAQEILAQQPQTSAQVIGHHKAPDVPDPRSTSSRAPTELERTRKIFPNSSQREYGFHRQFAGDRISRIAGAENLARSIGATEVKQDPILADALASLRSRVIQLETKGLKPKII